MPPVEQNSVDSANVVERKRWETPVVIVASAQRETLSNKNTGGIDGTYGGTTSYGS